MLRNADSRTEMTMSDLLERIREKEEQQQQAEAQYKELKARLRAEIESIVKEAATLPDLERKQVAWVLYWMHDNIPVSLIESATGLARKDIPADALVSCPECGKPTGMQRLTARHSFYAKHQPTKLCEDCQAQHDQRTAEWRAQRREQAMQVVQGSVKATPAQRFECLRVVFDEDYGAELRRMPYPDFLKTNYWDAVRAYKLYKAHYRCSFCNAQATLNVHHKTYEHHGLEHEYLDDLTVICKNCHSKFHDKLVD